MGTNCVALASRSASIANYELRSLLLRFGVLRIVLTLVLKEILERKTRIKEVE
ncbi:hypothetical protein [Brunnivagina elsteri]|uniref:hypothetical protein n=1 Tax=Brunnivagina elsteri TaxID=1247191 RepID=UPI0013046080|nr:hypothetical protein [Calothrix elsteri]